MPLRGFERLNQMQEEQSGKRFSNPAFGQILDYLKDKHTEGKILFTGDMTDTGSLKEWRVFLDGIQKANLAERVILLPGNHDLNVLVRGTVYSGQMKWLQRWRDVYLNGAESPRNDNALAWNTSTRKARIIMD